MKLAPSVDLKVIAARTAGFAGADLANLVNEAALLAARKRQDRGRDEGLRGGDRSPRRRAREEAGDEPARNARSSPTTSPATRSSRRVLPGLDPVHKISIVQRGFGALGYTMQLPLEDRYLMTREDLLEPAGGAARRPDRRGDRVRRDLDRRAERPAARHRHRARDGHRVRDERRRSAPSTTTATSAARSSTSRSCRSAATTPKTPRLKIDAEVKRILGEAAEAARRVLTGHRTVLDVLSERLLEKEVIEAEELQALLHAAPAAP